MEVDFSLPSERVIRESKQIIAWRGKPQVIRCEDLGFCHNGPEYISGADQKWAAEWGILLGVAWLNALKPNAPPWPTQHGLGRIHPKAATGHGCVMFLLLRPFQREMIAHQRQSIFSCCQRRATTLKINYLDYVYPLYQEICRI